ncbi:MAG TPA: hypothetical protein VF166_14850 [Gemmatimonadaceae bacterium]
MSRRGILAAVVLLLWVAGIAALAHRELFQGQAERLALAGRLLDPDAEFYAVMRHGQQVGFASSTADTVPGGIVLTDLSVTELPVGHVVRRQDVHTTIRLTRTMALTEFTRRYGMDTNALVVHGVVQGDSAITIETRVGSRRPHRQTVRITTPVLLPTEVPYAIALGSTPKLGQSYRFTVFDPVRFKLGEATVRVAAESLFVVSDSAAFDSTAGRWVSAHDTTVHAWRIEEPGGGMLDASWIDNSGRLVNTERPGGLAMHRMAYELAFENWKTESRRQQQHAVESARPGRPLRTAAPPARSTPRMNRPDGAERTTPHTRASRP